MAVGQTIGRRGVFFTVMALLIVAFIIATYKTTTTELTVTRSDTDAARLRVSVMNTFLNTFERYATSSLATTGYFALQNLSMRINATKEYIPNITGVLEECILRNTSICLYQNQTLNFSMQQLVQLASSNFSINTNYTIENVWVTEEAPFEVTFWMNISYSVGDSFASWRVDNRTLKAVVDVSGVNDPAFMYANGLGDITQPRVFVASNLKRFQFDNTTFTKYYYNNSYIVNNGSNTLALRFGPSVLQRYEGNLTAGSICCGIESIVRQQYIKVDLLTDPRLVNWSFVDYLFLSRESIPAFDCSQRKSVRLNYTAFPDVMVRLDDEHISLVYNASDYANFSSYCNVT